MNRLPPTEKTEKLEVPVAAIRASIRRSARRGFEATSLQEIADDVGVTKQALLYHFRSKATLKAAVIESVLHDAAVRFGDLVAEMNSSPDPTVVVLRRHIDRVLNEQPDAATMIMRFLLDRDEVAVAQMESHVERWRVALGPALAQAPRRLRPAWTAEALVAQVGLLVAVNVAVLASAPDRQARVSELVAAIGILLFPDTERSST